MRTDLINIDFDVLNKLAHRELAEVEKKEMIARRNHLIKFDIKAPKYLLEPEVKTFFRFVDKYNDLMLFKTMWITGGRVSEVLMLKPENCQFGFDPVTLNESCILMMPNLKQKIRVKKNVYSTQGIKQLPIYDNDYLDELKRYIATSKIKDNQLLFNYTRQNVNHILNRVQKKALKKGVEFPFKITAHTFRHSCAMNFVYNNVSEKVIKEYLGHSRLSNTEVYTKLFHLEQDISHVKF